MKNLLMFTLATALAAPVAMEAQAIQSDRFRIISTAGANAVRTWEGGFDSQEYASRDIWCVDQEGFIIDGLEYDVWATRMTSADFTKTKSGVQAEYQLAAYMSTFYGAKDGTTILIDGNSYAELALQSAIWRVMGFSGGGGGAAGVSNANFTAGTTILNYFQGLDLPNSTFALVDFTKWYVITAKVNCNPTGTGNLGTGCNYQEMIVFDPDRPQEVVPEPATMTLLATGLAGMAAARRRRKQA